MAIARREAGGVLPFLGIGSVRTEEQTITQQGSDKLSIS